MERILTAVWALVLVRGALAEMWWEQDWSVYVRCADCLTEYYTFSDRFYALPDPFNRCISLMFSTDLYGGPRQGTKILSGAKS